MMIHIAFTQHCGKNPDQQDALWEGRRVLQAKNLPCAHYRQEVDQRVLAVADGVANSPQPQRASRHVLETLATEIAAGAAFDGRLLRRVHGRLCDKLARGRTFGSSCTLAAAAIEAGGCTVLSVGDSRVYRITATGEWQQLSRDHTILNGMIDRGEAQAGINYAGFYNMLDSCLVADDEETEFPIHRATAPFEPGDALLICTDGVHDTLGDARLAHLYDPQRAPLEQVSTWRKAVLAKGAPDNFSLILVWRELFICTIGR